ncbi:MAG TPA: DNA gyrase subunit A [Candidatus Latescibacteria bacterium]|nr:DNA gyrase subunit A [Gemmatimonadota bacterium]HCR16810.1 DNA gyrase subunit A [Candidatus Latescibacterota bacterium]
MDGERIVPIDIGDELKKSMLDYSMSTLVNRALPDVRDGLKPSQRRILVAMNDLGLTPTRQHRKCANIAGHTSGNYHPHGEAIVYPTLVHLAQDFKMRYPLVNGQGNFGSIDGYPPAAMRYTEARMAGPGGEMLTDLDKQTVDFRPNYDERLEEPAVLPARFPNLICNGAVGIAVTMATAIPPHNVGEVVDGLVALIDNPETGVLDIMEFIKAPDFPTGGVIYGMSGVLDAYRTGRGLIRIRARAEVETLKNDRENIVITEIPYMVAKASLLERMADLVREKRIEGISNIRDESDRDGMRIVVELKRDAQGEVVLNQLFRHTALESTFGANMIALVGGQPKQLGLVEMLQHFVDHRHEVLVRSTSYELGVAEARAHILEGLRLALDAIERVIEIIRGSADPESARQALMKELGLSERQSQAILNMTLQRLTGLERQKIEDEYGSLMQDIERLQSILKSRDIRMGLIKTDLLEIKRKYGDRRRSEIVLSGSEFNVEDLIAEEDMVITISHTGYIKRMPVTAYRQQRRGGRGVAGMQIKDEDFVEHLFIASTHSYILFLTDRGHCHWLKVHEIPPGTRISRGRPVVNLIEIDEDHKVAAIVPVWEFDDERHLMQVTQNGLVKKTVLSAYSRPRRGGIIAMSILEDDRLIGAAITDGSQEIVLASKGGQAIRFVESDVRNMGRSAQGVRGITLAAGDSVVGMVVVRGPDSLLLTVCTKGYGKRTEVADYRLTRRGGKGVINIKTTDRNGEVVSVKDVVDDEELMLISQNGILIRQPVGDISSIGRNTQGVKLINLDEGDRVIDVAKVVNQNGDENGSEEVGQDSVGSNGDGQPQ